MKAKIIIILLVLAFYQCADRKNMEKKVVLLAENKYSLSDTITLKFYADKTYVLTLKENGFNYEKNEKYNGQYTIRKDTIDFKPLGFDFIKSDKGVVKNNCIEFLDGSSPFKMQIINNELPINETNKQNTDYSLFTFNKKFYNYFTTKDKSYDLNTIEVKQLDSLVTICINENNKKITRKSVDYFKQCIAVVNQNNEIIVWVNCLCKKERFSKDYIYNIIRVHDGGDCFFNVKVNLTKRIYFELYVNGLG